MKDTNSANHGPPSTVPTIIGWVAAMAMLPFAPVVAADELLCEVARAGSPQGYLIDIDDSHDTATVTDLKTSRPLPITVGELTADRVVLAFNSLLLDATEFVRDGSVVSLSLVLRSEAHIDRSANTMTVIGFVTDDKGEMLSLEQLRALRQEEEVRLQEKRTGPHHDRIFWLFLEVASHRDEGTCQSAPPRSAT